MRNKYIKPNIEIFQADLESLLAGLSGVSGKTFNDEEIDTGLDVDNEHGDDSGILCSKRGGFWDDDDDNW